MIFQVLVKQKKEPVGKLSSFLYRNLVSGVFCIRPMFLDTVKLKIPILEQNVKDFSQHRWRIAGTGSYLTPSAHLDYIHRAAGTRLTLNPRISDRSSGIHLPQVTLTKRGYSWELEPDGSLPRFYLGTNALELDSSDFEVTVEKYHDFFQDNGLIIPKEEIYKATVVKADWAKVILIPPGIPLHPIFENLSKLDFGQIVENHDKEYSDYRQGGKGLCITWGTQGGKRVKGRKLASFYEKIPQLKSADDKTLVEKELVSFLEANEGQCYQLLKFEECGYNKYKVNYLCNKVTRQTRKFYTFADLWDEELARKVLLYRTERLFSGANLKTLLLGSLSPQEIGAWLKKTNPQIRTKDLASIGFYSHFAERHGFKEMQRALMSEMGFSKSTKDRILRQIREASESIAQLPLQDVLDGILRQIQELKPIRRKEDLLVKTQTIPVIPTPVTQITLPFLGLDNSLS